MACIHGMRHPEWCRYCPEGRVELRARGVDLRDGFGGICDGCNKGYPSGLHFHEELLLCRECIFQAPLTTDDWEVGGAAWQDYYS